MQYKASHQYPSFEVIHVFAMIIPTIALPAAGLVLAIGSGIYFRSRRAEADKDLRDLRFR